MDQSAIDQLFERDADMRLLELRHTERGRAPAALKHAAKFGAESIVTLPETVAVDDAPRLRVAIAAVPQAGVIAGAVVSIAIDVYNDGTAPAPESKLMLSLPHESEYRNGTLRVDGRSPVSAEQIFAAGLPVARLPGGTSSKVTFQIAVLPGLNPLYLQPRLQGNGAPVVGTAGISIKRSAAAASALAPAVPETPFYELDPEEVAAVPEAERPVLPPIVPPPPARVTAAAPTTPWPQAPPQPPRPEPPVAAAPPPVAPAPAAAAAPSPAAPAKKKRTEAAAKPAEESMPRYRTFANTEVALLERLFAVAVPGLVAHYVMISTIACSEGTDGTDDGGWDAFVRRDINALGKEIVLARMGRPLTYRVDQGELDALTLPWQPAPEAAGKRALRLRRNVRKGEHAAIGGLVMRSDRDATLRCRIALLALAGATVEGTNNRHAADRCMAALASYRSAVLAWLVPLCVASAKRDGFVVPPPPDAVDAAGRRLVSALRETLNA